MDLDELRQKLELWKGTWPQLVYTAMKGGASLVQQEIKRKWSGEVLQVRSGKLRDSVLTDVGLSPIHARVYVAPKQQYKAQTFEQGRVIVPKKSKVTGRGLPYLTIHPPRGQWGRPASVNIPARPVFKPTLEEKKQQVYDLIKSTVIEGYK